MIIIGDVHGCYYTLLELLKILPKDQDIYFVGDLIDRGKNSRQVIDLIIKKGYKSSRGNHEQMMVDFMNGVDRYIWAHNGGPETMDSYKDKNGDFLVDEDHYEFIKNLPLTIEVDDILISHSHIEQHETLEQSIKYKNIIWNRGTPNVPGGMFHVFGHTPHEVPIVTENYANIDTGCVFGNKLTAIELPSKKIYQVTIDDRDKTRWS